MIPTPAYHLPSSILHTWLHEGFPMTTWQKKRKLRSALQMVLHYIQVPPESGQLNPYAFFLGHLWRMAMKGSPPSGQNVKQHTCLLIFLGRENDQLCDYILIHGLWPMEWLKYQGFKRNMIEKLVLKGSGGKAGWQSFPNGQGMWRYLFLCESLPKGEFNRGVF